MAGVPRPSAWRESADELHARYRAEADVARRKRLQVLWLIRRGVSERAAAREAGVGYRTAQRWLGWYRTGGLAAVLARVPGHGAVGGTCWLSPAQRGELVARCSAGQFRSTPEVRAWVERAWGLRYSADGMYGVLARLRIHPRGPRPIAAKADPAAQEGWKKGASPPRCGTPG